MQLPGATQIFETERFSVVALAPSQARGLIGVLLQDEALAARLAWMEDKSQDGALRAAFGIELQSAAGQVKVWSIVSRERRMQIGAILAKHSLEGIDVEVLAASRFWDDGVADEASEPVVAWLSEHVESMFALDRQASDDLMANLAPL